MRTLYIDCTSGVSGDMLLRGLENIAASVNEGSSEISAEIYLHEVHHHHHHEHDHVHDHDHEHTHEHTHEHGRSYHDVKHMIAESTGEGITDNAKAFAQGIYGVIAGAESSVHGMTLETVHFHEVGRDQAIKNALGIGRALDRIGFVYGDESRNDRILVSQICDGSGFVDCAHGRIPVPVPAVRAMMDTCAKGQGPGYGFEFCTAEDVDTEMVTPSGLAGLMGIGAQPAERGFSVIGSIVAETEVKGTRDTGRDGLRIYLIED